MSSCLRLGSISVIHILFLFELPNDLENYIQYRLMGSNSMKSGCSPRKFECQPNLLNSKGHLLFCIYFNKFLTILIYALIEVYNYSKRVYIDNKDRCQPYELQKWKSHNINLNSVNTLRDKILTIVKMLSLNISIRPSKTHCYRRKNLDNW